MNEIAQALPVAQQEMPTDQGKSKNAMGKDDFLKLFLTQLQHQDPMKPLDHHEFSAQMAQFTSLEQLTNIGKGIQDLRTDRGEDAKMAALGMIGKRVSAAGNEVQLMEVGSVALSHSLPKDFAPVRAAISDGAGKLVRELDLASQKGAPEVVWDGKDTTGTRLPPGKYSFRVQGVNGSGQSQEATGGLSGVVSGVEMEGKTPMLILQTAGGRTKLEISRVKQVSLEEATLAKPAPSAPAQSSERVAQDTVSASDAGAAGVSNENEPAIPDEPFNSWRSDPMGERL